MLGLEKRKEVIEMLWKVCLIDNNIDPYEDMLIRNSWITIC